MISPTPEARVAQVFLVTAVAIGLCGMILGLAMGVAEDFRLRSVHVHLNLIGFATLFLAGLFYRAYPEAADGLAWAHYGLTVVGLGVMAAGLVGIQWPVPAIAWMVKPGSVLVLSGMGLFLWIVARGASAPGRTGGRGLPQTPIPATVIDERRLSGARLAAREQAERIIAEAARACGKTAA